DVDGAGFESGTADEGASAWADPHVALDALVFRRQRIAGGPTVFAVDIAVDDRLIRPTEANGRRHHGLQHRIEIEHRAADDPEDIAGGGLIFERLLQIAGALPQLGDQ